MYSSVRRVSIINILIIGEASSIQMAVPKCIERERRNRSAWLGDQRSEMDASCTVRIWYHGWQ